MNNSDKIISLYQLNIIIKGILEEEIFTSPLWIMAEISELKVAQNGHCYLELAEKQGKRIVAKARGTIWNSRYPLLKSYFEEKTGMLLERGIKILFRAEVRFHELYGFSLNILDIDPTYTLGDLARQREEAIARLKEEGIFELNKELYLPVVIQRIAIISSKEAAGYEDFLSILNNNPYKYKFKTKLFPSLMQGEQAATSLINALDKIYVEIDNFDIVVIIRGGGSKLDLNVFDNYEVAANVAQFPIPVITGIGHTRDLSVVDMVANYALKTPTDVADEILNHNREFENSMEEKVATIINWAENFLLDEETRLQNLSYALSIHASKSFITHKQQKLILLGKKLEGVINSYISNKDFEIKLFSNKINDSIQLYFNNQNGILNFNNTRLQNSLKNFFTKQEQKLDYYKQKLELLRPEKLFKRGYHLLVNQEGKAITDINQITVGQNLNIYFRNGKVISEVKEIQKIKNSE